jgi:DNA polymerase-3 subunit alpha
MKMMKNKYTFDCGCSVDILDEKLKESDGLPSLKIPYSKLVTDLNYEIGCSNTWDMIGVGKTKGVFQLESALGKNWSERLKPTSLEEMSALISLIRPGCLNAMMGGKSMTQHYIDRKFNLEETKAPFTALEQCGMDSTYFILVYQEQIMRICKELAGFSDVEADNIRKGVGKKDAELLFSMQQKFMDGCDKVGLASKEEAKQIFDWFKESARYSFNKSHGIGYGVTGYLTAWTKYHFPLHFFCSWLKYAKYRLDPYEEIRELIGEAKLFDITVDTPSIDDILKNQDLSIHKDHIRFGFNCIKKIGDAALNKLVSQIQEKEKQIGRPVQDWTWFELSSKVLPNVTSSAVNGLICGGVLDKYGMTRNKMLSDYELVKTLTVKQLQIFSSKSNYEDGLQAVFEGVNKGQKQKIADLIKLYLNPPTKQEDSATWTIIQEKELYGVPITFQPIDVLKRGTNADTTCKEFAEGKTCKMSIGVEIEDARIYKVKNGQNKGKQILYLKVSDGTASIDAVAFTEAYEMFQNILYKGNLVFLYGERSNRNSFLIRKAEELI